MTQFLVYDVFSGAPFGGNQLAIIPDASNLPEADLQKIAREFNFSESTFVFPPENPAHTAQVRIFTPTMEIPFAGHPLIGTVCALADEGAPDFQTLELGVGPLKCEHQKGKASFTTTAALEITAEPDPVVVAEALGTRTDALKFSTHPPILASLGLAFTITELKSRDDLAQLSPDTSAFKKGRDLFPSSLDFAQFAYVRVGNEVHARMFAPLDNIPEDPATGSACATLGALLAKIEAANVTLDITQGEDMGRPSCISVTTSEAGVTVSGQATRVMQGTLVYGQ